MHAENTMKKKNEIGHILNTNQEFLTFDDAKICQPILKWCHLLSNSLADQKFPILRT